MLDWSETPTGVFQTAIGSMDDRMTSRMTASRAGRQT